MANYLIHFDGSCWPNPGGVAAYGYTIDKDGVEIAAVAGLVPPTPETETSNNVAEFYALYEAARTLAQVAVLDDKIEIRGDSQIVINIMDRKWRPNAAKLYYDSYRLARTATEVLEYAGADLSYRWIPREDNSRCDDLSKEINNAAK